MVCFYWGREKMWGEVVGRGQLLGATTTASWQLWALHGLVICLNTA